MRKFLLGLALVTCFTVSAQQEAKHVKASNGEHIGFYEYKPSDYQKKGEKYPLIIFLHGIGERGNGTSQLSNVLKNGLPKNIQKGEKMRFYWNGKWETFLVLSPQLSTKYGAWQNFYVDEMLEYAEKKLNVDPDRIYLTGLSLGGGGVWNFASASSGNARKLAAIAPICGTCQMKNADNIASADLPIWAFHAKNDDVVGVGCTLNAIRNIRSANPGVEPIETIWDDGRHGIWDRVYNVNSGYNEPNLFEWFLGQSRKLRTNKMPVAKVPASITVPAGVGKVKLDGSASYDPDGKIVRHIWKKVSGPSGIIGDALSALYEVTGLNKIGKHEYELKVVDDRGNWDVARVVVDVVAGGGNGNKSPKADAGRDVSITLPTSSVELSGGGSEDEDGRIASYKWSQKSGPSNSEIVSSNRAETEIKNLREGTYKFTLTVTDDKDDEATDEVTVTVNAEPQSNKAPKADAGNDIHIKLPANSVTLNGDNSSDEDGRITSYSWTKVSGPAATIKNPGSSSTKVNGLTDGTYVFRLTVKDDKNSSSTADVKVIVAEAANAAPIAVAGENRTIQLPTSETVLNGNKSSDKDGTIVEYVWSKVKGPKGKIKKAKASSTKALELEEGIYVFRLQVKDDKGATSSADVEVVVTKKKNKAPKANAGAGQKIQLPKNEITLDGRRSSDEDGSIKTYNWRKLKGPEARIQNDDAALTRVSDLEEGSYTFRLTVTDNDNESSTSDVDVVVDPSRNKSPNANAGGTRNIKLPQTQVTLNGSKSSDEDGSIVSYSWSKVKGGNAKIENASGSVTVISDLGEGAYKFRLVVTDNKGASSSDEVDVFVAKGANTAPIAKARGNSTIQLPANGRLDGSGSSDPDGTIKSYEWKKVSGPSVNIENASSETTEINNLQAGTYVFRLIVTDNENSTSSDDITVKVENAQNGANKRPVARAGEDRTIKVPASSVIVDGVDSYDEDGKVVSYSWTKVSGPDALIFYPDARGTSLRHLTQGTYVFRLTVTDNDGATDTDDVVVNVLPRNTSTSNISSTTAGSDVAAEAPGNADMKALSNVDKLQVFPNPVVSSMNAQINSAVTGATSINVYDASGKIVKRVSMQKVQTQIVQNIDVSDLRPGIYHLEVIVASKTKMVTRFIKK